MKPYYEHAGITIYHGDCREVLPSGPEAIFDVVRKANLAAANGLGVTLTVDQTRRLVAALAFAYFDGRA